MSCVARSSFEISDSELLGFEIEKRAEIHERKSKMTVTTNTDSIQSNSKKQTFTIEELTCLFFDGGVVLVFYLFIVIFFFFVYLFTFGQHLRGWRLVLSLPTWIVFFLFLGFKSKILRKRDSNAETVFAGAEIVAV